MSAMLKFKYYGHHVMSRKFKYRYIEIIPTSAILQIPNGYHIFSKNQKFCKKYEQIEPNPIQRINVEGNVNLKKPP
jgi:hypothetical protein